MDNMHNAELYGRVRRRVRLRVCVFVRTRRLRVSPGGVSTAPATHTRRALTRSSLARTQVLRCNYAQPQKIKGGEAGWSNQPVWADADDYQERLQQQEAEAGVVE